ncbi:MAG TPA: electron transfer flavoprotein-ubiquinone oxidoreductase [Planctomycetota bacterium]|nr:electron transfer flavoprotein-ubiquinone oxidoreductase [Planctomycetota bacterium]
MADREVLETDVLIVGGGPAGLACAIALHDKLKALNVEKPNVFLIEKGVSIGAHSLSGAVMDPKALDELIPDWKSQNAPVRQPVTQEEIILLTRTGNHSLPGFMIPPYLHNHGNYIISLVELTGWLAEQARARGIEILEGVAGAELVLEGSRVVGVRCGDTGIGKDGQPRSNYMPGTELRAKVTILAEGVRGSLTKQLIKTLSLSKDRNPQIYALGVKEIWELPSGTFPAGKVIHTLGYPLQKLPLGVGGYDRNSAAFGGCWVYGLKETTISLGLVVGLDYSDPTVDPHNEFNRLKSHPYFQKLLEKGKLLHYGAKAIPEGGYYSMPRMYGDGFLICGDSASFLNAARLKGVHMALKSGMLAAEAVVEAIQKSDFSEKQLARYDELFQKSWAKDELYSVRNWRASYAKGLPFGAINDMFMRISGGRGLKEHLALEPDCATLHKKRGDDRGPRVKPDGKITFDKMSDVYLSGTNHDEDQPCHLKVPDLNLCVERCTVEYGNPCQYFCPAGVYEWLKPEPAPPAPDGKPADPRGRLHINAGNCVHCKTCDIKDPYENILWVVPEGGGGPRYQKM